jgi:hypothetical protein
LYALAVAALLIGSALVLFPADTPAFFAWTIKAPIAGVTLGAWFLALGGFAFRLARVPLPALRLGMPVLALGSGLMLVTTLLHWGAFNRGPAAWLWLLLYAGSPPVFAVLWRALPHAERPESPGAPLPAPARRILLAIALLYTLWGLKLFLLPAMVLPSWPWPLLPLGARVYASFLIPYGLWAFLLARSSRGDAASSPLLLLTLYPLLAFLAPWIHFAAFKVWSPGGIGFLFLTGGTVLLSLSVNRLIHREGLENPRRQQGYPHTEA